MHHLKTILIGPPDLFLQELEKYGGTMKLKGIILLAIFVSFCALTPSAVRDHNNPKKKADAKKENWATELKKSVQFNFGVPLPNEVLTAQKNSSTGTEEAASYYNWIQKKYAEKMAVDPSEVSNETLYNFINEWYGVRYVYGGTTQRGVDCSSFVQKLMNAAYNVNLDRTAASQFVSTKTIQRDELKEGDLVFFKIKVSRISHVGVYLKNNCFVHAASSKGVMISNLNSTYWNRYFAGGGRIL